MKLLVAKLKVIPVFIFLLTIFLSCSDEKLAKENAELTAKNQQLEKEIHELKSKIENQSKPVAKEAVSALKKVEARLQVGISYQDYTKLLGETLHQVNLFLESPESTQKPELAQSIRNVFSYYMMIKTLSFNVDRGINLYSREDDPLWQEIITSHPGAKWNDLQYTIQLIMKAAGEELKKTTNLLQE